jgi:hypothetical protein
MQFSREWPEIAPAGTSMRRKRPGSKYEGAREPHCLVEPVLFAQPDQGVPLGLGQGRGCVAGDQRFAVEGGHQEIVSGLMLGTTAVLLVVLKKFDWW